MARFVVDCGAVLQIAAEEIDVAAGHELLAPTLLRSQTLSALHEAVHRGEMRPEAALEHLAPALLAALVVTQALGGDNGGFAVDARLAGLAAGAAALVLRAPLLAVIAVAAVTAALVRLVG